MKHASLFSGIGGFDLAAAWMGWENIFQVEKDKYCTKVLEKNFPQVARYGDIKEFDGTKYRGTIDVLTGGFPCQPFSVAGKRKGKTDDRFLWSEMLRVIGEVKPSFIVGENVTGIIDLAIEQVLTEVEAKGYHTETFIIPASALNANHKRNRVWIIAYAKREGLQGYIEERQNLCIHPEQTLTINSNSYVFNGGEGFEGYRKYIRGNDGVSRGLDKHRVKALGNAIVPQVAFELFKAIKAMYESTIL